jgi:hypothetical protein
VDTLQENEDEVLETMEIEETSALPIDERSSLLLEGPSPSEHIEDELLHEDTKVYEEC